MRHALVSLLLLGLVLVPGGGCFALMGLTGGFGADYVRPIVFVIDGETGEPIAGARVHAPAHSGAWTDSGTTDKNGRVRIRVAEHVGDLWAEAEGYMNNVPDGPFRHNSTARIALFRPPVPVAGLVIPRDFRGALRVREGAEPQPPTTVPVDWPRGQREFYTPADVHGVTELGAPPKLTEMQAAAHVSVAQWDDGTPLRYENPTAATGWGGEHVYVLPTIRDRVPPRADGVALFRLGTQVDLETVPRTVLAIYFIGTRGDAAAEQKEWITGATARLPATLPTRGHLFQPTPIDRSDLPASTELSPQQAR